MFFIETGPPPPELLPPVYGRLPDTPATSNSWDGNELTVSSAYSAYYDVYHAFDQVDPEPVWVSTNSFINGEADGTHSKNGIYGEWIEITFPEYYFINHYSIKSRIYAGQKPHKWYLFGYTEGIGYYEIHHQDTGITDEEWLSDSYIKSFDVDTGGRKFNTFTILITHTTDNGNYTGVNEIFFMGTLNEEGSPPEMSYERIPTTACTNITWDGNTIYNSSYYSAYYNVIRAFDRLLDEPSYVSDQKYINISGYADGSTQLNGMYGEYVSIEFPISYHINSYTIQVRIYPENSPALWYLLGWNESSSDYDILHNQDTILDDADWTTNSLVKSFPADNTNSYKKLVLIVTKVTGGTHLGITELFFMGAEETTSSSTQILIISDEWANKMVYY